MKPLDERLRAANPVPQQEEMDGAIYGSVLERAVQLNAQTGPARRLPKSEWSLLLVACLLLAVGMGVGVLLGRSQQASIVAADPASTQVALAYIDARNNGDAETALGLLDDTARIAEYPVVRSQSELPAMFRYLTMLEENIAIDQCTQNEGAAGTVSCTYQMENLLTRRAKTGPVEGTLQVTVEDQRIVSMTNTVDLDMYVSDALDPWFLWIDLRLDVDAGEFHRLAFHLDEPTVTPRLDAYEVLEEELGNYVSTGS